MKQKQYYNELNVLSGIAILCVLAIHGCGSALNMFYAVGTSYAVVDVWLRAMSNLVAPAVPIFLFVSGFKFAANDAQTPYGTFLKKRLPRVLMSFAILNTLFWLLDSIKYMESFDLILLAKTYIHSWVGYSVAYQLWYIPMYCCVIVLCPLVRRIIPSTVLRFCVFAVIGIVQRVLEVRIPMLATYPIRFVSYPVFFELGALAHERNWRTVLSTAKCVLVGGDVCPNNCSLVVAYPGAFCRWYYQICGVLLCGNCCDVCSKHCFCKQPFTPLDGEAVLSALFAP